MGRCAQLVTDADRNLGALQAELKRGEEAEAKLKTMPVVTGDLSVEEATRAVGVTESELKHAQADAAKFKSLPEIEPATTTHAEASRLLGQLQTELKEVEEAEAALKALPPEGEEGRSVNECDEGVRMAEQRLAVWKTKTEADRIAGACQLNLEIVAALANTGVRKAKLEGKVGEFNARLKELCKLAGWKTVELDAEELKTSYNGWQYRFASTGEQYRIRAILQVAMAQMDGSDLLIFDEAGVLDGGGSRLDGTKSGRAGLFQLLREIEIPAVVLMTEKGREAVPDIARLDMGRSYWLEAGTLESLSDEAAQKVA